MRFGEVIEGLRVGKKYRRKCFTSKYDPEYICAEYRDGEWEMYEFWNGHLDYLYEEDFGYDWIFADDWEEVV